MNISNVEEKDVASFTRLLKSCLPDYDVPQDIVVLDILEHQGIGLHIDNVAGVLCCVELGICDILYLGVSSEHRRKGYASALLDAVLARHKGDIILTVRESNTGARALYESRGFKRFRFHPATRSRVLRLTR